jgi:hypothetical protein
MLFSDVDSAEEAMRRGRIDVGHVRRREEGPSQQLPRQCRVFKPDQTKGAKCTAKMRSG